MRKIPAVAVILKLAYLLAHLFALSVVFGLPAFGDDYRPSRPRPTAPVKTPVKVETQPEEVAEPPEPQLTEPPPAPLQTKPIDPPTAGLSAGQPNSQSRTISREATATPVVDLRPVVFVYSMNNCPPCLQFEADKNSGMFPLLHFVSRPAPAWVESYPTFHYRSVGGTWKQIVGYTGPVSLAAIPSTSPALYTSLPIATGEAAHTPLSEVVRVLGLLPKPEVAFADLGCGYDARWCIAAAERWGCKCIGIEIDPGRANAARERVRNLGLDNLITIVEGDAGDVPLSADVGVAYLFPELLARLKPRLESFKAFASYIHQPPGMSVTKNGDTWIYRRQVVVSQSQPTERMVSAGGIPGPWINPAYTSPPQQAAAVWQGMTYSQPLCNSPRCAMCNSIRRQLGQR